MRLGEEGLSVVLRQVPAGDAPQPAMGAPSARRSHRRCGSRGAGGTNVFVISSEASPIERLADRFTGKHARVGPSVALSENFPLAFEQRPNFHLCLCILGHPELREFPRIVKAMAPCMRPGGKIVGFHLNPSLAPLPANDPGLDRRLVAAHRPGTGALCGLPQVGKVLGAIQRAACWRRKRAGEGGPHRPRPAARPAADAGHQSGEAAMHDGDALAPPALCTSITLEVTIGEEPQAGALQAATEPVPVPAARPEARSAASRLPLARLSIGGRPLRRSSARPRTPMPEQRAQIACSRVHPWHRRRRARVGARKWRALRPPGSRRWRWTCRATAAARRLRPMDFEELAADVEAAIANAACTAGAGRPFDGRHGRADGAAPPARWLCRCRAGLHQPGLRQSDGEFQTKFVADRLAPLDAGKTMADLAPRMVDAHDGACRPIQRRARLPSRS